MAWQKTKICLISTVVLPDGQKKVHRYMTTKSKGKGKPNTNAKLILKKYNPITRKHETYTETKIKWK
jgi:ribosomal protein L33